MADTFIKTAEPAGENEDDWKDVVVEKKKVKTERSNKNYREMERDWHFLNSQIIKLTADRDAHKVEMDKVKAAVEA